MANKKGDGPRGLTSIKRIGARFFMNKIVKTITNRIKWIAYTHYKENDSLGGYDTMTNTDDHMRYQDYETTS
jgi:hypothetical protein